MKTLIIEIVICLVAGAFGGWFFSHEMKKQDEYLNIPDTESIMSKDAIKQLEQSFKEIREALIYHYEGINRDTTYKLYKDYPEDTKIYQGIWEDGKLVVIQ